MLRACRLLLCLILCSLVLAVAPGCRNRREVQKQRVVIICIEGARSDLLEWTDLQALHSIKKRGASAETLVSVFPTNSTPNLASIATGCYPEKHCAINNRFFDRAMGMSFAGKPEEDRFLFKAEPVWVTAERSGVKTAVSGWDGITSPYQGIVPTATFSPSNDAERTSQACKWLSSGEFGLVMVYLTSLDDAGHDFGPLAPEARAAALEIDSMIARIVKACGTEATVFVLSDHGMMRVRRCLHLVSYLRARKVEAQPLAVGGTANLYLKPGESLARALDVLRDQAVFKEIHADGFYTVYSREEIPEDLHCVCPSRTGDILLIANKGNYFREHGGSPNYLTRPKVPGMHGFLPDAEGMAGIFLAAGAGIKPGARLSQVRCIDINPTACRLLGIDPAPGIDGRVIEEILTLKPAG